MTTFDERIRALRQARSWLEAAAIQITDPALAATAQSLLEGYPARGRIEQRLLGLHGYPLMAALQAFERTAFFLEGLSQDAKFFDADAVRQLGRHFPDRQSFAGALRDPQRAAAWAAFELDRPPGRMATLMVLWPPDLDASKLSRAAIRQRRESLRQLRPFLERLATNTALPVLVRSDALLLLTCWPVSVSLGRHRCAANLAPFSSQFSAVLHAVHLVKALSDESVPATRRVRHLAVRIGRGLPCVEAFPLTELDGLQRQAWVDWLFLRRPRTLKAPQPGTHDQDLG